MIEMDQARPTLKEAMETQGPDFVYSLDGGSCYYLPQTDFSDSDPRRKTGCLIGVALDKLGVTVQHEYGSNVHSLWRTYPGLMSEDVAGYFQAAQVSQDRGDTWGRAVEEAEAWWFAKDLPEQGDRWQWDK